MLISLNQLVSLLASRVGKPFSSSLQEEMKVVLNYKRADFFKKLLVQNPYQRRFFLKDFSVTVEKADKARCPVDVDCDLLVTTSTIPTPVRTNLTLFDYVGDPDFTDSYSYGSPEQIALYSRYNKYTSDRPRYFFSNGYIYIYGDLDLEYIGVRGLFDDPKQLEDFKCEGDPCYTDDDQYNIPDDLINAIIADTLRVELRQQLPDSTEVQVGDKDQLNDNNSKA